MSVIYSTILLYNMTAIGYITEYNFLIVCLFTGQDVKFIAGYWWFSIIWFYDHDVLYNPLDYK